jgi:hypothetical protein
MAYSMVHIEFAWKHNYENSQKNRSQRSRIESRNSEIRNGIANYYTVVVLTYEVLFRPKHESYSGSVTIHKQVFLPVQTGLLHRLYEYFFLNCATFTNLSCRQVSGVELDLQIKMVSFVNAQCRHFLVSAAESPLASNGETAVCLTAEKPIKFSMLTITGRKRT